MLHLDVFKRPVGVLGISGQIMKVMITLDLCVPGEAIYLEKENCGLA